MAIDKSQWARQRQTPHPHEWEEKWDGELRMCSLCGVLQFWCDDGPRHDGHDDGWRWCMRGNYASRGFQKVRSQEIYYAALPDWNPEHSVYYRGVHPYALGGHNWFPPPINAVRA